MCASGNREQHFRGGRLVSRLAEDQPVEHDGGIRAEDHHVGVCLDGECLLSCQAHHHSIRILAVDHTLVDIGGLDAEIEAGGTQQELSTR